MPFIGGGSFKHSGVTRGLLIQPESTVREMGDGVEPMQSKHRQSGQVDQQITPHMMRDFMSEREALLNRAKPVFEINRHDDCFADEAKRDGR